MAAVGATDPAVCLAIWHLVLGDWPPPAGNSHQQGEFAVIMLVDNAGPQGPGLQYGRKAFERKVELLPLKMVTLTE